MSKTIEISEQDYERIRQAAESAGVPLEEWVVANLPLNGSLNGASSASSSTEGKPLRTMADALAGRVGLFDSRTGKVSPKGNGVTGLNTPPRTMAERLAGRLGLVGSGTGLPSSDHVGQSFGEYLEEKHRSGHL
jgi:hypothetical protein